jgi:drug/metabolite transporter (DMT)-like permease
MVNLKNLNSTTIGIISKIMNLATYSALSILLKISLSHVHTFQILFLLNISGLIITSSIFAFKRTNIFKIRYIDKLYISRSFVYTLGIITWVYSLSLIPITEATSISYITPLLASLLGIFLFKEYASKPVIIATILGVVGMIIILKPFSNNIALSGVMFALLSAILWAVHDVIVKAQSKAEPWLKQAHIVFLLVSIFSLPMALSVWKPLVQKYLFLCLGLGLLSIINKFFLIKALSKVPLVLLSPISFLRLVFTAVLAYILFGESLDIYSIIGVMTIIYSTSIAIRISKKSEK